MLYNHLKLILIYKNIQKLFLHLHICNLPYHSLQRDNELARLVPRSIEPYTLLQHVLESCAPFKHCHCSQILVIYGNLKLFQTRALPSNSQRGLRFGLSSAVLACHKVVILIIVGFTK